MDKVDLTTRDHRNLYRDDAENVTAYEVPIDGNVDIHELDDALIEISEEMKQRGQRFGYVVLKIVY